MSLRAARITLAVYLLAIYATLGVVRTITNFLRDHGILRVSVVAAFAIAGGGDSLADLSRRAQSLLARRAGACCSSRARMRR